jgi:hypothetical protein
MTLGRALTIVELRKFNDAIARILISEGPNGRTLTDG